MANVKLVYINSTGGYVQSTGTTDVAQSLGKIELTGVAGVALDAGAAAITNLPLVPTNASDATSKSYVDSLVGGATWVDPVLVVATGYVNPSGNATVDGVALTTGDRILLTNQQAGTSATQNGIYVVNTSGAWARSADVLQDGTAMFVEQGTTYADTQWVLTTSNPIVPDTTPLTFVQFGATTTYSAGSGLNLVGTTFSVKGDGTKAINVDASAGVQVKADAAKALNIDATNGLQVLADTNYGLSIDATTGLRVDLDTTSGLEFNSGNLRIDVANTDQLSLDANGLNVVGLPSQFKINGSAVSTNVNQTNLDNLTDSSTITALHRHQNVQFTNIVAYDTFADGEVAYYNIIQSGMGLARADSATTSTVVGVAVGAISGGGNGGKFLTHGAYAGYSGLTAGAPYYLSDTTFGGLMLYSALTSGSRAIRIGYALSATTIAINIQDMGVKP